MPLPAWLFGHDPQSYAYEEYEAAASSIEHGTVYVPTNVPPPGVSHRVSDLDPDKASPWLKGQQPPRARL